MTFNQTTEIHTHLMVRMAFWLMLTPLVKACRETPTLMMMKIGHWEKEQVIHAHPKIYCTSSISSCVAVPPYCSLHKLQQMTIKLCCLSKL